MVTQNSQLLFSEVKKKKHKLRPFQNVLQRMIWKTAKMHLDVPQSIIPFESHYYLFVVFK